MKTIHVNWDLTYACQLRCVHCHSQAGRRPSKAASLPQQLQIANRLIDAKVVSVAFTGGEPILEPSIWDLAETLRRGGITTALYTNGFQLCEAQASAAAKHFDRVHVSLDGPHAAVHDLVRGRPGAFAAAVAAIKLLLQHGANVGIELTLLRSTFDDATRVASEVLPSLPGLAFLNVGAVMPSGLASRPGFGTELLTERQLASLDNGSLAESLSALALGKVAVTTTSNRHLSAATCWPTPAESPTLVQIEPDGGVRAMPFYEGTVGSLLHEPLDALIGRAQGRRRSAEVAYFLSSVSDASSWANATRRLDWTYASVSVRNMIERRSNRIWMSEA